MRQAISDIWVRDHLRIHREIFDAYESPRKALNYEQIIPSVLEIASAVQAHDYEKCRKCQEPLIDKIFWQPLRDTIAETHGNNLNTSLYNTPAYEVMLLQVELQMFQVREYISRELQRVYQ